MVEELRKIILSFEEVLLSLEAYRRVTPGFLPAGKITNWRLGPEATMIVEIEPPPTSGQDKAEISFKAADLFEPAVKFCLSNNIMLPRNSRKCVRIEQDRLALYVIIGNPEEEALCVPM